MFFLSLVCWSYIFYAAFKTNFDGRSVNEVVVDNIKSSKSDGEEESHLEDLATDHSPSLCVLRDTEENRALAFGNFQEVLVAHFHATNPTLYEDPR